MKIGFSTADLPWHLVSTETLAKMIIEKYPNYKYVFRFPGGESSQRYDYNSTDGKADYDAFERLVKYLRAEAVIVLDGYNELVGNEYAARSIKSNEGLMQAVKASGMTVLAVELSNEMFTKDNFTGWVGTYGYKTTANIANMQRAADRYMVWCKKQEVTFGDYKYAHNHATDLNLARRTWDNQIFTYNPKCMASHLYPSKGVTGQALKDLFAKRLNPAISKGIECMNLESNSYMGFKGDTSYYTWSLSTAHLNQVKEIIEVGKSFGITVTCLHKLLAKESAKQPYSFLRI
jgi:hypothetical protein